MFLLEAFAPLCAAVLVAIAFVIYAVCHVGGCNDTHIDRYNSEKEIANAENSR